MEQQNREQVGIIQIAKANLVDDPSNKIQLQTGLRICICIAHCLMFEHYSDSTMQFYNV